MANPNNDDKVSIFIESVVPSLTREEIDKLLDAIQKRLDELEMTDPSSRAIREGIRAARARARRYGGGSGDNVVAGIVSGMKEAKKFNV